MLGGGGVEEGEKLKNALQIITRRFNDPLQSRDKIRLDHKWAQWLHDPYRLGGPQHSTGDKIGRGP